MFGRSACAGIEWGGQERQGKEVSFKEHNQDRVYKCEGTDVCLARYTDNTSTHIKSPGDDNTSLQLLNSIPQIVTLTSFESDERTMLQKVVAHQKAGYSIAAQVCYDKPTDSFSVIMILNGGEL